MGHWNDEDESTGEGKSEDGDGNAESSTAFPSSSLFQYDGDDTSFNLVAPVARIVPVTSIVLAAPVAPVTPLDGGRQVRLGDYGFS